MAALVTVDHSGIGVQAKDVNCAAMVAHRSRQEAKSCIQLVRKGYPKYPRQRWCIGDDRLEGRCFLQRFTVCALIFNEFVDLRLVLVQPMLAQSTVDVP